MNRLPIVYQIYPRSFMDSNGDGIGDVNGIRSKLDYLKDLGIDMVWLTPIFISPQKDNGYDVADYRNIDPLFGTMEDVEALIQEAKDRGIGIMFDMVLNHSSTEHEWFKKALTDPKYRDYYIFKDKPTNWVSKFGGNAWEYVEDLDAYYLHLFDKTQADLNWENEEVFEEIAGIVNFWLDKGITGLRFDVINLISKPDVYEDDFEGDGRRFYTDGPRVHEYLRKLNRATYGRREGIVTVGEMSSTSVEQGVRYAMKSSEELSTIFNFHHLKVDYKNNKKWEVQDVDFQMFKDLMKVWQESMQEHDAHMSLFLNNHDQPRAVSRFADDKNYPYESATMLAGMMQLMRGMPYIYQGEEIGLPNAYFNDMKDYRDVESLNYYDILRETKSHEEAIEIVMDRSRDNSRTPIPWNHDVNYGFTEGTPWIGFSKYPNLQTVEDNLNNEKSVLKFYKALIKLRKESETIDKGSVEFILHEHPEIIAYHREYNGEQISVFCNFYGREVSLDLKEFKEASVILSNYDVKYIDEKDSLSPFEILCLRRV